MKEEQVVQGFEAEVAGVPFDVEDFEKSPVVEAASEEYLGHWNRLVSMTNWEKGRIIAQWRDRLAESDAPLAAYTDEAWSRRVGNVSPQHVGRLRRVYQRFGESHEQYAGLFWTHFQAALDWSDAEMWLEGAVQNGWSISQMREQRWESLGAPPKEKPRPEDVVAAEVDEDVDPADDLPPEEISDSLGTVRDTDDDTEGEDDADTAACYGEDDEASTDAAVAAEPLRPFENLPSLPTDVNEAFELFKLAILSHKLTGWEEIACDDVVAVLESLKQLALAPA